METFKKKKFKKKKILTTFQDEEEEEEVFVVQKIALERNRSLQVKEKANYSLDEIKQENKLGIQKNGNSQSKPIEMPHTAEISFPEKDEIEKARRERERKRRQEQEEHQEYIQMDNDLAQGRDDRDKESLGNIESDDDEDLTTANQYESREIVLKSQMMDIDEDVDEDNEWEFQQIQYGSKEVILKSQFMNITEEDLSTKIPPAPTIMSIDQVIEGLSTTYSNLKLSIKQYQLHQEALTNEDQETKAAIVTVNDQIKAASVRYEFFSNLNEYTTDLVDFLDAKEPLILDLEADFLDIYVAEYQKSFNSSLKRLLEIATILFNTIPTFTLKPESNPRNLEDIKADKQNCFKDASKQFRKIQMVKNHLETWKIQHPLEYDQGYGALSLVGIFDLYVRHELLDWCPFIHTTEFEEMTWHQELVDFGVEQDFDPTDPDSKLLMHIVESSCIPRMMGLMDAFDITQKSHTINAFKAIHVFLDYTNKKSNSMRDLFDCFQDRIESEIDSLVDWIPEPAGADSSHQDKIKEEWINFYLIVLENVLMWKKYLPSAVVEKWAYSAIIDRAILPILETHKNLEFDLNLYLKISTAVREHVPDVYETPSELKKLEVSFLKNIHVVVERDSSLQKTSTYQAILKFLTDLKSFQACSLVAKRLNH